MIPPPHAPHARRHPRGLTLLEVLAATVLLSIMALACMPLLRSTGTAAITPSLATTDLAIELRTLADAVVAHPEIVGCKDRQALIDTAGGAVTGFVWPDREDLGVTPPSHLAGRAIEFHVLKATSQLDQQKTPIDHAWLIIRCGESRLARWIKLPPPPASPSHE